VRCTRMLAFCFSEASHSQERTAKLEHPVVHSFRMENGTYQKTSLCHSWLWSVKEESMAGGEHLRTIRKKKKR